MSKRVVALAGNPNVGKSTVFNELTGMHQHTGNWIGKTVDSTASTFYYKYNDYTVVDLPGTYSLHTASPEEEIAKTFLSDAETDCTVCVVDAALLERSLVLVLQILNITNRVIVLLNLCDEAKKKGIAVDDEKLRACLGVPVVKATARSGKGINALLEQIHLITTHAVTPQPRYSSLDDETIYQTAKAIAAATVSVSDGAQKQPLLDKLLLGRFTSFVSMALLFGLVLWITVELSNYPSQLLQKAFDALNAALYHFLIRAGAAPVAVSVLTDGVLKVLFWVVAVMLPPMAIFFPLFALMEEAGILPRIAFNLDYCFEKCGACGKQALCCCMGLGCNAVGVTGARIIDSPRERLLAIVTNSLTPCNGRFPILLAVLAVFFPDNSVVCMLLLLSLLALSFAMTLLTSRVLSKTVFRGIPSSFVMELPPYRMPQVFKTIVYSLREKVLAVLWRAVAVAAPAGLVIWSLAHITVGESPLLIRLSSALAPIGNAMGMDGVMLLAFLLAFPANELVLPVALMTYLAQNTLVNSDAVSNIGALLLQNGWSTKTALCVCVFTLFHFPCSTTVLTIWKETKSVKWTLLSVVTPLVSGTALCLLINLVWQ